MPSREKWARGILVWGLVSGGLGLGLTIAGFVLRVVPGSPVFLGRLVPAIGIVLIGLGIASLVQYAFMRRSPEARRQLMINECDERLQWIRARAGQRAFRISSALAFALLMWASVAGDVGLPTLSSDALWFALAVVVVVPSLVYIGSIMYEQTFK